MPSTQPLAVLIHAPTPTALERARNNAANLLKAAPDTNIRIIVNAQAVTAALDAAPGPQDALLWLCPNTLANLGREARDPLHVLHNAAILELATLQAAGWLYIRA